jgi:hypothetical protein
MISITIYLNIGLSNSIEAIKVEIENISLTIK